MKFIDAVDMNLSNYNIRVLANSTGMGYEALEFRFSGTNEAAQTIAASDLGRIILRYRGKQRQLIRFDELQAYDGKKYGSFENISAVGAAFSFTFLLPFSHVDDKENVLWVPNDTDCKIEWQPDSGLAAKVVPASSFRVMGIEKSGSQKYIFGFNRVDIAMVAGNTRPEPITPYNISSLFIEYNTNIDSVQLDVDAKTVVSNAEIVEILNYDLFQNKIETYAASGYAEIDLVRSKKLLESLNNDVQLKLTGTSADTISAFWTYFDYTPTEKAKTDVLYAQLREQIISAKVASGGLGAVNVLSSLE